VCKTVGSAYVGSNPTPATTSENGPLAAETRPVVPFPSCHAMYQRASPWVDAAQCVRTYGVQRRGGASGAYNRRLRLHWVRAGHLPAAEKRCSGHRWCRQTGSGVVVILFAGDGVRHEAAVTCGALRAPGALRNCCLPAADSSHAWRVRSQAWTQVRALCTSGPRS
jgi:hypothetical protein